MKEKIRSTIRDLIPLGWVPVPSFQYSHPVKFRSQLQWQMTITRTKYHSCKDCRAGITCGWFYLLTDPIIDGRESKDIFVGVNNLSWQWMKAKKHENKKCSSQIIDWCRNRFFFFLKNYKFRFRTFLMRWLMMDDVALRAMLVALNLILLCSTQITYLWYLMLTAILFVEIKKYINFSVILLALMQHPRENNVSVYYRLKQK